MPRKRDDVRCGLTRTADYDVVIVGLGPAGSSLAYFLRSSGLRVAGIDMVGPEKVWGKTVR